MIDEYRVWQDEKRGAPVEHCRAKMRSDEMKRIANEQANTRASMRNRDLLTLRFG